MALKIIKRIALAILTIILVIALVYGGYFMIINYAPVRIKVDTDKAAQTFDGFGASACWGAQIAGAIDNAQKFSDLLYDDSGLALGIYRYNIGAGEKDNPNSRIEAAPAWRKTESFYYYNEKTKQYEYDFNRDAAAQKMLDLALKTGNVHTVVLFANSPHYSMTESGQASGSLEDNKCNLPRENYQAYVDYFLTITEYFVNKGVPVKYISPFNEPQWCWGGEYVAQEGCHYEPDEIIELLELFSKGIDERGLDVKLCTPESGEISDTTKGYFDSILSNPTIMKNMGTLAYHSYFKDEEIYKKLDFGKYLNKNCKNQNVSMSEWTELPCNRTVDDFGSALLTTRVISNDISIVGVNSWSFWTGVHGYSIDENGNKLSDGLVLTDEQGKEITLASRYYGFAHFSKYVQSGATVISAKELVDDYHVDAFINENTKNLNVKVASKINVSAFENPDKSIVVVVVNENDKAKTIKLNDLGSNCTVIQSTENNYLADLEAPSTPNKIEVPANSITTIIYKE